MKTIVFAKSPNCSYLIYKWLNLMVNVGELTPVTDHKHDPWDDLLQVAPPATQMTLIWKASVYQNWKVKHPKKVSDLKHVVSNIFF